MLTRKLEIQRKPRALKIQDEEKSFFFPKAVVTYGKRKKKALEKPVKYEKELPLTSVRKALYI